MAQLGRVERLAKLGSSWETFSGAYGAELKVSEFFFDFRYWFLLLLSHISLQSLLQDQDVLFGPYEAQFTAIAEANLKRKEDELAQAKVVLTYEKEQRALTEAALNAKVLDAEKACDTA